MLDVVENIVRKGENASIFSYSHNVFFLKPSLLRALKPGIVWYRINSVSLPNDKILDWSKFKAFANTPPPPPPLKKKKKKKKKKNAIEKLKLALGRVKHIVVSSIFSFFHNVFKRLLFQGR